METAPNDDEPAPDAGAMAEGPVDREVREFIHDLQQRRSHAPCTDEGISQ